MDIISPLITALLLTVLIFQIFVSQRCYIQYILTDIIDDKINTLSLIKLGS